VPADASSLIPSALDQLREQHPVVFEEVPGLLERLAQVPDPRDPRDPRGVRHALVVLALTACAVLAGATSLLAIGTLGGGSPIFPSSLDLQHVRTIGSGQEPD